MERKEIVREYEKQLSFVSKGEAYGETVMVDLIKAVHEELPKLGKKIHKLLSISEIDFETETIEEYLEVIERSKDTVVGLYNFETNNTQIEVIEEILLMVDKDEFLKILDVRFNNEGDVL